MKTWKPATVLTQVNSRSYIVQDENGHQYRRNRLHLRTKEPPEAFENDVSVNESHKTNLPATPTTNEEHNSSTAPITTRSGRVVKTPKRYT